MNSQGLIFYIKNNQIKNSKILEAFGLVLEYMFEQEKMSVGILSPLNEIEIALVQQRKKLEAVKEYMKRCNVRLMDSKKVVESYMVDRWGVTSFDNNRYYEGIVSYNRD